MDIETVADLTNESQAKLANAKSRALTCTLVMKAINSEKSLEEIKDIRKYIDNCTLCCSEKAKFQSYPLQMTEIAE